MTSHSKMHTIRIVPASKTFRRLKDQRTIPRRVESTHFGFLKTAKTRDRNINRLEKKFEKKTLESKAMTYVIEAIREKLPQ
ncbi:MAG: hypothetical protein MZU97_21695 [Bacillus subtilis]|nr:hypothetical protein [Bacillus subtilis]